MSEILHDTHARRGVLRPLSVAPMADRTDRHFRWFLRLLTRRTLLYTEMISTGAILHGDCVEILGYDPVEHPLALQLGGDDPSELAECAGIGCELGYDEINLNVGCPSDSVRSGRFGACLMARPERVADAVAAMRTAARIPVTVKHRIGIDEIDRFEDMARFVATVAEAGCDRFIVHARTALLDGLSPKQNRRVPPLRHGDVHRLKREHPRLAIEINGGIRSLAEVRAQLALVDGVMIGRAAYDDPYLLAGADREIFEDAGAKAPSRLQTVEAMLPYLEEWAARGARIGKITRHLHGLFAGQPGSRAWKRALNDLTYAPDARPAALTEAIERVLDQAAGRRHEP